VHKRLISPDQELRCVLSLPSILGRANAGFVHMQVFLPGAKHEHADAASLERQKPTNI
jgi:hypothetical protein